jgi:hypothetical protein
MVVKEEIGRQKNKFTVSIRYPHTVRRQTVLENMGEELGLRLRDEFPGHEALKVNCFTEELQSKALGDSTGAYWSMPKGEIWATYKYTPSGSPTSPTRKFSDSWMITSTWRLKLVPSPHTPIKLKPVSRNLQGVVG